MRLSETKDNAIPAELWQPLQGLLEQMPIAVFCKNRDLVYVWGNHNFIADAGLDSLDDLVGKTDDDLPWTPEQTARFCELDQEVMLANKIVSNIVEQQTIADGQLIWVERSKAPICDEAGQVVGVLGIYRNITLRKQAQEDLRDSKFMMQLIMDNIPQSIFWKDSSFHYLGCNQPFAIQAGANNPDELIGKNDHQLAWQDQADLYREMDRRVMETDSAEYRIIEPQTRADGSQAWLNTNKVPLHNASGDVVGILGTYEDITERVEAEHELQEAYARMERLVQDQSEQIQMQMTAREQQELAEQEQQTLIDALRSTAAMLTSTLDLDEVLDRILSEIGRVVPHDSASIVLIEDELARTVRVRSAVAHLSIDHELNTQTRLSQLPNHQHIIKGKQPFIIQDTVNSAVWVEQPHAAWVRSYLGVPIRIEDNVIGLINLNSSTPGFFGPRHAERLQAFADQAAIAIQNARLYEGAQELAALQERQRLARDLHDAVSQTLWTASLMADVLPTLWLEDQAEGVQTLQKFQRLTRGALAEMRTLLMELRPKALVEARLSDLLSQLAEAAMSRKRIDISLQVDEGVKLSPDVQIGLYRIAQEGMNNVVKHSHATMVEINLTSEGSQVRLAIRDNGRGFELDNVPRERFGVSIMRERADAINALLQVDTSLNNGTVVTVVWPKS